MGWPPPTPPSPVSASSRLSRLALLGSVAFALTTAAPTLARAEVTKAACLGAHEKGQQARSAGRLREARENFLVCAADGCPGVVRTDCNRWADDLSNRLPSIVIGAKDRSGRDLFDVKVTIDGAPLVDKLDGKSVVVDPGPHTFEFKAPGMPTVRQTLLVKEGDRARPVEILFEGGTPPSSTRPDPYPAPTKPDPGRVGVSSSGPGVFPWLLVGVGGVGVVGGLVYSLTAPALPTGCDSSRGTCTKLPGETEDSFAARREQAGKHDTQGTTGLIIAGGGGVVLAAGLVWVLVASSGSSSPGPVKKAQAPLVLPWVAQGSAGVAASAAF